MKTENKTVLQFSGGKDSIACLLLLKDRLPEITVLWVDTGDAFPETYRQMEEVKKLCPNFVTVHSNQPQDLLDNGVPVDILPIRNHVHVQQMSGQKRMKMQPFLDCCYRNIMRPMHEATLELGATTIIRGQKSCDDHKGPYKNGDVVDGITYLFPIEDWSDEEVMEFVKDSPLLPKHYSGAMTSLDCMHCTAYLADNTWKLPYLEKNHPIVASRVRESLRSIKETVESDMSALNSIVEAEHEPE